jgi:formylglycine-generating enzyme required for sulfatase activity
VTFLEWDAAIAAGAKLEKPGDVGWGRDRRPAINVSWNDAKAYIAWLNGKLGLEGQRDAYRLPSEAEWEYACRAGTTTPFSFGAAISRSQAQFSAGSFGSAEQTVPVGSFPANAFGLHDMHGNVWEWCEDAWNANYKGAPTDGSAWLTGDVSSRVSRGGSWYYNPSLLRSARRTGNASDNRNGDGGFRVARTL